MFSVFFPVVAGGAALVFATGLTAASLSPFVGGGLGLLGIGEESIFVDICLWYMIAIFCFVNLQVQQELEVTWWHRQCV